MDGALKPNDALDAADLLFEAHAADNIVMFRGAPHCSSQNQLLRIDSDRGNQASVVAVFPTEVTCLAALGDQMAVGLENGKLQIVGGLFDGLEFDNMQGRPMKALTVVRFMDPETLVFAIGSQRHSSANWRRDLLEGGNSGSVWKLSLASKLAELLNDGMGFPYGLELLPQGRILVSESWKHRIVEIAAQRPKTFVEDLPFYPARLSSTSAGGLAVCGFAPRLQLFEFILQEKTFIQRMMAEIPEPYWAAPTLSSGCEMREPTQRGQIRQNGAMAPWAPTRSYGLVAVMDIKGDFVRSYHCRAGGKRHGVTSFLEVEGRYLMTAKGGDAVLSLPVGDF